MAHNCVGIFCEDVRDEVSGSHTIVGVLPDNINIAGPPPEVADSAFMFPKMGIFLRINLDGSQRPKEPITARATFPGNPDFLLGEIGIDVIENSFADAKAKSQPIVGLIFKAVFSPLPLRMSGQAIIYATIEGQDIVSGVLNIQIPK
jgi:hypothetical protein